METTSRPAKAALASLISALAITTVAACALLMFTAAAEPAAANQRGAAKYLRKHRDQPARLNAFLYAMPKGGDLHMHLSGAVYGEEMLKYGAEDGKCADLVTLAATEPPCGPGERPLADAFGDNVFQNQLLRAWSMKGFIPGEESGHDHFFATFDKFGDALDGHVGEGLATITRRARSEGVTYIEPLLTPAFGAVRKVASSVPYSSDFDTLRRRLIAAGLFDAIPSVGEYLDSVMAQKRKADPAGSPVVRFDVQVLRAMPPKIAFAQMLFGFELMRADRRWVGINLVQPEDDLVALRNYRIQMRMMGYLHRLYPSGRITLHAGELNPSLARPSDLRFHITQAVEVAHADRIGHGVDIFHERNPLKLVREMARKKILVESPLVSNRQILGISGRRHPIRFYLSHGVPVALATDDEGVSRTDLSRQFVVAVRNQHLGYRRLKQMAVDSLRHSFAPASVKRRLLARQRRDFRRFEARFASR